MYGILKDKRTRITISKNSKSQNFNLRFANQKVRKKDIYQSVKN